MMISNQPPAEEDKTTFATNWYDQVDTIFQLCVSEAIWEITGETDKPANVEKVIDDSQQYGQKGRFFLITEDDERIPIGAFEFDIRKPKWIFYANGY